MLCADGYAASKLPFWFFPVRPLRELSYNIMAHVQKFGVRILDVTSMDVFYVPRGVDIWPMVHDGDAPIHCKSIELSSDLAHSLLLHQLQMKATTLNVYNLVLNQRTLLLWYTYRGTEQFDSSSSLHSSASAYHHDLSLVSM